nr:transmembrane protein 163 isoform X2 [Parasteatoda tepidariorum]
MATRTCLEECRLESFGDDIPIKPQDSLFQKKKKEHLRIVAITICFVSVFLNLILSVLAITFASLRHSPATFAFAADCGLDLFSSLIVIWRYFGTPYSTISHSREVKACLSLGILFVLAGTGVIFEGIYFLCIREVPNWYTVLLILSAVGAGFCILLSVVKYILSKKLESDTLFLDALNSALSGLFAFVIIVSDIAYWKDENIWFLDPVLSIILSVGLIAFGIRTIIIHGKRIEYETNGN